MGCTFYIYLPMSKSHLTQYLSKNISAQETAPLYLYKPIKLATYSYRPECLEVADFCYFGLKGSKYP